MLLQGGPSGLVGDLRGWIAGMQLVCRESVEPTAGKNQQEADAVGTMVETAPFASTLPPGPYILEAM